MEENQDGSVFSFCTVKPILIYEETINDKNLDFYTLGVLVRLKYLIENNLSQDRIWENGNQEYIAKALEKLEKFGYLKEIADE